MNIKIIQAVAFSAVLLFSPYTHAKTYTTGPHTAGTSAETYTMDDAVQQALKANPNIKAADKSAEAAESARNVARGNFGPTVNAGYILKRSEQSRSPNVNYRAEFPHDKTYNSGVTTQTWAITASQPIFTGFKLLNTAQKAALEMEYQQQQAEKVRITIVNAVQSLFLKYLMSEESVKSSERSLERAKKQLDTAQTAFKLGLRPKIDVLQAELDMSATQAKLIENENTRDTARAQLNSLLNIPVDAPTAYIGNLTLIPFDKPFEQCVEKAFAQRPDIQMAQKSLEKMEKDLGIAQSTFLPQIMADLQWGNVDGSGTYRFPKSHYKLPVDYDVTSLDASISIGINLFSSGKRYNTVKQVKAGIQAMAAQVEAAYNTAAFEIKSGLLKLQDSRRTISVAERALASANQSYSDAKLRYELQLGTNLEMLTALSGLANAEQNVIAAKAGYLVALSNLYTAMGEIHPELK